VPAPVALVIVQCGGRRTATTVTFFSEVAHHPTSLWVSLHTSTLAHELLSEANAFSLAVLNRRQAETALFCGTVSGRTTDKCAAIELTETGNGFLYLAGAMASTACNVRRSVSLGDHTLFIADMIEGERDTRAARRGPLLTVDL
jgi:flavin reductase (DIM6/NTAB) family NADH-FMN oxidoreductase RutF